MADMLSPGWFAGYAAIFSTPDAGRDVLTPGAFRETLDRGRPPLLWQHRTDQPVGVIERLEEDQRGLRLVGRLTLDARGGREARALMKSGALSGLSIGYAPRRASLDKARRLRRLEAVELIEISLVTLPMHPEARVLAVG